MDKKIELAKKLKQLAEKGIGGEKINAEEMLKKFMKKNHITDYDIENDENNDFFFTINDKNYYKIWYQIVKITNNKIKTYGKFPDNVIKEHALDGNYMINCTHFEYIEISTKYNFYMQLFKDELNVFLSAFLHANDLLMENPNPNDIEDLTKEQYLHELRILELSKKVKKGYFNKQIKK